MALDLNPDSAADRAQLAHIEQAMARERFQQAPGSDSGSGGPQLGTQKLMGLPPITWIRGLTAASVIFLVSAMAFLLVYKGKAAERKEARGDASASTFTSTRPL